MANKNVSVVKAAAAGAFTALSPSIAKTLASATAAASAQKVSVSISVSVNLVSVSAAALARSTTADFRAVTRILFDGSGNIAMIAILDNMNQINDPAFSPPGLTAVNISVASYTACGSMLDLLNACLNSPQGSPSGGLSLQIQSKINAINADIAAYQQSQIAAAKVPITDGPGM